MVFKLIYKNLYLEQIVIAFKSIFEACQKGLDFYLY